MTRTSKGAQVRAEDGVTIVALQGELGNERRDDLQDILQKVIDEDGQRRIILDLTKVTYMASFAVAAVGYYFKIVNDRGGILALVLPGEQLNKPFRLAGLAQVIPIFPDIAGAKAALHNQDG